jgi:hypothetical protein
MTQDDVAQLRAAGLDDRQVHDVVMIAACFAFMNRLADGTGVALHEERHPIAVDFFGHDALTSHLNWAEA